MMHLWCFSLLPAFLFYVVSSGDVLMIPPMISGSHKIPLRVWAELLTHRGHTVYWWAPAAKLDNYQPKSNPNIHIDHYAVDVEDKILMDAFRHGNASFIHDSWWTSQYASPYLETYTAHQVTPFCVSVIVNHKESFSKVISRKYDMILVDEILNPCGWLVAQLAEGPVAAYVSTSSQTRGSMRANGVPIPHSYFPTMGDLFVPSDRMSFIERVRNMCNWIIGYTGDYFLYPLITKQLQQHVPQIENIQSAMIRPHIQFLSIPKLFDFAAPQMPNLVNMGGLQIPKKVAPLNDFYSSFVERADKGFILMSFGHWGNWNVAPNQIRLAFIEAFRKVPSDYSIIWQYNGPAVADLPNNIYLNKWVPLNSLLAEPKCKLFITHCGCNSLTETGHHGVPIIAVPLSADQPDGAAKAVKKGFGVLLKKSLISTESVLSAIMEVLTNDSYSKNVKKFSAYKKSFLMTPEESTIFWSEFVMKHYLKNNGSYSRTSMAAVTMSWLQYNCLDIMITFFTIGILLVFVVKQICCNKRW